MSRSRALLRRDRVPVTRVVLSGLLVAAFALTATPAIATPSLDPDTQAAALADEVDRLQTRAEVATERWNAVEYKLSGVVTTMISASERLDDLGQVDAATQAEATRRISAIYKSGGTLSLYATVLDGGSPNDMVTRLRTVQDLVGDDLDKVSELQRQVDEATATKAQMQALARQRTDLEREARDARDAVDTALNAKQKALDDANAEIRRLAAEEAARRQAAAEGDAAAAVGPVSNDAPGNPYATAAIAAARSKIGKPYVWGGTGPNGYDCSGLVQWAYREAGLSIMRVAADQYRSGPEVALSAIAPGDLVFWATNPARKSTIHHVAMYVGSGKMIEAPHTGAFVREVPLRLGREFAGAVRPGLRSR